MNYKFKNPSGIKGEVGCALLVHKWKKGDYKDRNYVYGIFKDWIEYFFKGYNCAEIEVDVIHSRDVMVCCCGCRYNKIYFDTAEYSDKEIWYPVSRFYPTSISKRMKLILDKG